MKQKVSIKLKVANVNIVLILVSLICSINIGFSQNKIIGVYYVDNNPSYVVDGGEYEHYEFYKSGLFTYSSGGDLGKPTTLKGDWRFLGQTLILSYSEPKLQESYKIETASSYTLKDSVSITFKVKDFNNGPTLGLYINILPLNLSLITDENGFAETKFKKSNNIIQGNTEYLGYEDAYFSINLNKNQNIKISINEKNNDVLKKQNDTLNIVTTKKDYFKVKEKNGKISVWKKIDN